jgi:hypothetical protein
MFDGGAVCFAESSLSEVWDLHFESFWGALGHVFAELGLGGLV